MNAFIERVECEDGVTYTRYDEDAPVLGFSVAPFNWRLRRAREAKGWSRRQLGKQSGVRPETVGRAEKLKHVSAAARWAMALALEVPEDLLFPGELDALPSDGPPTIELSMTSEDVLARGLEAPHLALTAGAELTALRADLLEQLDTLTGRERQVLLLRFGFTGGHPLTLKEVGQQFGAPRERIRQIEVGALRKLRHPQRAKRLREYYGERNAQARPAPRRGWCERYLERPDHAFCSQAFALPGWIEAADDPRRPSFWCEPCWQHFWGEQPWPCAYAVERKPRQACFLALPEPLLKGRTLLEGARKPAGWCDACWAEFQDDFEPVETVC